MNLGRSKHQRCHAILLKGEKKQTNTTVESYKRWRRPHIVNAWNRPIVIVSLDL